MRSVILVGVGREVLDATAEAERGELVSELWGRSATPTEVEGGARGEAITLTETGAWGRLTWR